MLLLFPLENGLPPLPSPTKPSITSFPPPIELPEKGRGDPYFFPSLLPLHDIQQLIQPPSIFYLLIPFQSRIAIQKTNSAILLFFTAN